jgi:hypothetical protein
MIGKEEEKPDIRIEPMAGMFLHRLMDLVDLRFKIDSGELPIAYFGEIPIAPNAPKQGLRWGVLKGINDAYQTLTDTGYEMEARAIVSFQERRESGT